MKNNLTKGELIYLINEQLGQFAKGVKNFKGGNKDIVAGGKNIDDVRIITRNLDDAIKLLKNDPKITAYIDSVVKIAKENKSHTPIEDLYNKLVHYFDPSGLDKQMAVQKAENLLAGYAKTKNKPSIWSVVDDNTIKQNTNVIKPLFSGKRISNRTLSDPSGIKYINTNVIANWGGSVDNYNKVIANAIQSKDFRYISRGGFEKFGIVDFREYLKSNIAEIIEINPSIGRWSVIFK
jgi:hypothetical protein